MITPKDITKSAIYPVIILESWVSERNMRRLTKILETCFMGFVIVTLFGSLLIKKLGLPDASAWTDLLELKLFGVLSLLLLLISVVFVLRSYLRSSYYFENVVNNRYRAKDLYTFTVGRILYRTKNNDYLRSFLTSETGSLIMTRCGVSDEKISELLGGHSANNSELSISEAKVLKMREFALVLYQENEDFRKMLFSAGIVEADFLAVVDWVVKEIEANEMSDRWWWKENLDRIGSIGKGWSFGVTPHFDLYGEDLLDRPEAQFSIYDPKIYRKDVRQLQAVLSRRTESNALLVGESDSVRMDVLWEFVREINRGSILPDLAHKRVFLFNTAVFLAGFKERAEFEREVMKIFNEAIRAGDLILVFSDFPDFLAGAEALHSEIFGLLDRYFGSSRLKVIALAGTDKFHRDLESRTEVMARFEKIFIADLAFEKTVETLQESVDTLEKRERILFSYPALKQIIEGADSYLADGSLSERSKDFIAELVPWAKRSNKELLLSADISEFLRIKTNIPFGAITEQEKIILQNLEKVLHERIEGQDHAVSAVAGAMKRARVDVQNSKRPLGSFLFLGPTGVGKTETAKALAAAYFGHEDKLMRLDMTEYQSSDSVDKLIGSIRGNIPGTLANILRQNMFGVLLLDEFEKSDKEVQNLFLQILDEGIFSDMNGKRINARNIIFIATSNAGSGMIWNMMKAGKDPAANKDVLVSELVGAGTFKPELLNRFDDIVIFHPLSADHLRPIALRMLNKLAKRLEPKGINLVVNDGLAALVSREGANEAFGARPMNRFIQDKIEQLVADKIISGELKPGSTIELRSESSDPGSALIPYIS